MIRRTLMRRAYNAGNYSKALHHAEKLVDIPREQKLARSVIIRSYWNQQQYEEIVQLLQQWKDSELLPYLQKSIDQLLVLEARGEEVSISLRGFQSKRHASLQKNQPIPVSEREWNKEKIIENFFQENQRIWFRFPQNYCYWDMPEDFNIEQVHPSLLGLVAELLLSPWHKEAKLQIQSPRKKGSHLGLSFSAGTDSTAAYLVLPDDTILGYHERSFESQLKHDNAKKLINHLIDVHDRKVLSIPSNHEIIRTYHDQSIGFSTDLACASHLILLADHLDLGGIAFGMPVDNSWLWKGRVFRNFENTPYFQYWTKRFSHAGLDLTLPIAGVSEAGAMKICQQSELLPYLNSCMRKNGNGGCGECWKCFHKNGPLGRPFNFNAKEIQVFLNRKIIPTAMHALWAIDIMGLKNQAPLSIQELLENDFSWWDKVYPPSKEIIPSQWREHVWERISTYLEMMEAPYPLEMVNLYNEILE
ncbi:MAG: hypothetical protein DWC09_04435 [Candidatus Poseidoniales archaeon]|nr:MAG: hypothetical protein DWC09_04435 [Candidatus Poseidoniales archaeon]